MDNYIDPIQGKDEESNLDAEFIKVEKESVCSHKSSPSRDLLEAQEKVQELEHELVSVSRALKDSESEVTRLKDEVLFTNKKLQESEKSYDELEISNNKLQKQISEAEGRSLQVQETKQKAMNDVQEAYDDLQLELETSKKKMLEVNQELQISEGEALKFEELHRQSGVHAEMEMKKALEFERLLEMAKVSAVEVEDQMATLQGELVGLYEKIAENEKLEEALRATTADLSTVQGELKVSKLQILDLEKRLHLQEDSVNKVAVLESELSSSAAQKSELELQLKSAMKKEEVLNESLNMTTEEKINLADALNNTTEKLVEAENSLQLLQSDLNLTHQKLVSTESNLEAAGLREIEVLEKLKLAEELLEKHRDLEVKLQEVIANFNSKDFEVQALEEQVMIYKEQTMEAAERSASLKEEFTQIAMKLANSESANEELKKRVSHAEDQATQYFSEIDMLVETNTQLKSKINELQELLNSEYAEKEETSQKLSSHLSTIMELKDRHSRASEQVDSHKIELEQTLTRLKDLESMVKELESRSSHFEKECEGLAGVNFNLTQELSEHESKLNDVQTKLSATLSDRDEATEQLHASQKTIEDLKLQLDSDSQRLQSQISSVMEENNLLTETHHNAKEELQTAVIQLERQIKQHISNEHALTTEIENLKAEVAKKSALSDRLKELEEQLAISETHVKEEKEVNVQKEMEADANKKAVFLLENQVKELEQKLQLEDDAKTTHKDIGASSIEMKSRDIGTTISTPSKDGHTKKLENITMQSSSLEILTTTTEVSTAMNFKFILIVALVSVIIGAILGKRY
ncbi:hypothetical protein AgCh_007762 [Apium graveolens]